ncbi:hypothetical protein HJC99_04495 [Candidatus Saccharibacteria bacterium]|nr:hypothetical protein [Candidatus Saccharibacteria bacterium]
MKRWTIGFVVAMVAVAAPWAAALAATPVASPAAATANPGQGLEISPPVLELNADPGQTVTAVIRVRNVSSGTLVATGKADDFGASGEDGKPKLLLDETSATRYSLKFWVASVPTLILATQELKTATVQIVVPKDAEPGGHYGVIRFTGTPPNLQGTGVSLSASVGTLVLLRVSGAITDSVKVASFTTNQAAVPADASHKAQPAGLTSSFFEHGPINFVLRIQNDGTVHEQVKGNIVVKNTFGKTVATVTVNPDGGNVLPGTIRRFEQSMANKRMFGYYKATFTGSYLDDNHKLASTVSFWVIPWKLILLIILGIAILIWLLRLAFRRYNAFIIAQARKR